MPWKIPSEPENQQNPATDASSTLTKGTVVDLWGQIPAYVSPAPSIGHQGRIAEPLPALQHYGTGPDGTSYPPQTNPACLGPLEHAVMLDQAANQKNPHTRRSDPRVIALWDFLCRQAFMTGRETPPDWMKTAICQWHDYLDRVDELLRQGRR